MQPEKFRVDRDAIIRVGFEQRRFARPIVVFVGCEDDAEALVVFDDAFEDLLQLDLVHEARAGNVRPCGGNDQYQWLRAGAHAGLHGVVQLGGLVLVVLVNNGAARRCAVARPPDYRLEFRVVFGNRQV